MIEEAKTWAIEMSEKKSQVGNATLDEAELKMISTNAFAKRDQVEISLLKKTRLSMRVESMKSVITKVLAKINSLKQFLNLLIRKTLDL